MTWSVLPFDLGGVAARVDQVIGLRTRTFRLECVGSTRSAPALRIELASPIEARTWAGLMEAFVLPDPGASVLLALAQQVLRDREVVTLGVDGSLTVAIAAPLDANQMATLVSALGCDAESACLNALSTLPGGLNGFSCGVLSNGSVAVTAHHHTRDVEQACRAWESLAQAIGWPPSAAALPALVQHASAAEPSVTLDVALAGREVAFGFEVPDVPADRIETVFDGEAPQRFFTEAREALLTSGQHAYRAVALRRSALGISEVCVRIDVGDGIRLAGAPDGQGQLDSRVCSPTAAVRIVLPEAGSSISDRLMLSAGTSAPRFETDGPPYRPEAIVPRLPWRRPTDVERSLLVQKTGVARAPLAIVRADPVLLAPLRSLAYEAVQLEQVEALRRDPRTLAAQSAIADAVAARYVEPGSPITCLGISAYRAGQRTVSYDHQRRRRVGLHVDTWDEVNLDTRLHARSILLVNLGSRDRHFLYINLDIAHIRSLLPDQQVDADRLVDAFMRRFPSYPVVKARVAPGEAYIAPVQGVIHDGSTDASDRLDLHVAFLGQFLAPGER
jgi:hypothetical protein